jgi:hypothetical protein
VNREHLNTVFTVQMSHCPQREALVNSEPRVGVFIVHNPKEP